MLTQAFNTVSEARGQWWRLRLKKEYSSLPELWPLTPAGHLMKTHTGHRLVFERRSLLCLLLRHTLVGVLINHLVQSLRHKIAWRGEGEKKRRRKKKQVMKCFWNLHSGELRRTPWFQSAFDVCSWRRDVCYFSANTWQVSIQPPPYCSLINLTVVNKHNQQACEGGSGRLFLSNCHWWVLHHCYYAD